MYVSTAEMTDREGALRMIKVCRDRLGDVLKLLADGGYTGKKFAGSVKELLGAEVEIAKRSELHTFVGFRNAGGLNAPSVGLRSAAVFGRTANASYRLPFKCSNSPSSESFLIDAKQALMFS
jgi:transposase